MDPVIDVVPADPSPAIVAPETTAPAFDMDSMSPADRQKAMFEGKLPQRIKPEAKSTAPPADKSAAPVAGTEPDSDPEDEDKLTPQENKKRNKDWRNEVVRLKDEKIRELQEQIAAKQTPAPAAPKVEDAPKPVSAAAKAPRLKDYPNTDEGVEQWQADTEAHFEKKFDDRLNARFNSEKTAKQTEKVSEAWDSQINTAKTTHGDYLAVAGKVSIPAACLGVLKMHAHGAEILYHLGRPENAEELKRIQRDTDIDGMDLAAISKAASDLAIRDRFFMAQGLAKAEFNRIALKLANPPVDAPVAPEAPVEIKETKAPKPPRPIGGNGAAVVDPLALALKEKNWAEVNRIKNEQAASRRYGSR